MSGQFNCETEPIDGVGVVACSLSLQQATILEASESASDPVQVAAFHTESERTAIVTLTLSGNALKGVTAIGMGSTNFATGAMTMAAHYRGLHKNSWTSSPRTLCPQPLLHECGSGRRRGRSASARQKLDRRAPRRDGRHWEQQSWRTPHRTCCPRQFRRRSRLVQDQRECRCMSTR